MPPYFFDLLDEGVLSIDDEGLELPDLRAVQAEAAKSLADVARDAVHAFPPAKGLRSMAIEVRNEAGSCLQVKFTIRLRDFRTDCRRNTGYE
ncbi:hypothetical protein QRQ56_31020 [Bradyrhizobium sp. U531]|uniref:DUF6894 family protein n=1 Tax=Bradyrhizobium sp. U531 TaxID=3053458 RepID=UPI003F4346C7